MNILELLESLAQRVSGDRTVIPAVSVRYGFGGGGGNKDEKSGGGSGGGRVSGEPWGALEITPQGIRFIPIDDRRKTAAALALGFLLGAAVASFFAQKRLAE